MIESYSVLTRMPAPGRLGAHDALALIEANWRNTPVTHLTAHETWEVLRDAERRGVTGGRTYDLLVAAAALKAEASTIVTWNLRDFALFESEINIKVPD